MSKYQISLAASFLYDIGVSFHATGTIESKKVKLYDYYKVDSITESQKQLIVKWCKDAKFMNSAMQYAPELKSLLICFPKAGFYKQQTMKG